MVLKIVHICIGIQFISVVERKKAKFHIVTYFFFEMDQLFWYPIPLDSGSSAWTLFEDYKHYIYNFVTVCILCLC